MAKSKTASHDDLIKWLGEEAPPEEITIEVRFGKQTTDFHFTRSFPAYSRYMTDLSSVGDEGGPQMLAVVTMFLIDSVKPDERKALSALLNAYPAKSMEVINPVVSLYSGDLSVKLKNVSTPAGT